MEVICDIGDTKFEDTDSVTYDSSIVDRNWKINERWKLCVRVFAREIETEIR